MALSFLKKILASTHALGLNTQKAHWNVQGSNFYGLHNLFEAHYKNLNESVDDIAERLRALGELAPGTYEEFTELTLVHSMPTTSDSETLLKHLVADHLNITGFIRDHLDKLDAVTEDMMIARLAWHDEAIWMLKSHLQ